MKYLIYFIILFSLSSKTFSQDHKFYEEYLTILKENYLDKEKIDWINFEKVFYEKATISKDSAIQYSIKVLDNIHTSYITKDGQVFYSAHKPYFQLGDSIGVNFVGSYANNR